MIKLNIDGNDIEVEEGTTLLEAARKINIDIPTLCYMKGINEIGDCRMCLVEIEGRRNLVASCIQKAEEGMVVRTNTEKIYNARRTMLQLILSEHNRSCLSCTRNGNCELQKLAIQFNIDDIEYEGTKEGKIDDLSPSLVRDTSKCILCKRCVAVCKNVQGVSAISVSGRGHNTRIACSFDNSINESICTLCGQCIEACPVGALKEKDIIKELREKLNNKDLYVVVQTAPAVRVALGEEFGMKIGTNVAGKMVAALKKLGFDKVFDTNTGADFTIMEEGTEFIQRLKNNGTFPMITSCSPGWINFIEINYPELLNHLSSCKSPHEMFGAIIKSYYAEKENIHPKKIVVVSVMPCIAKKYEAKREQLENDNLPNVDIVITTRELARMIKQNNIDFINLEDETFDSPMGEATGAAAIFGTTGGVMEAALRTVEDILTGKNLEKVEYTQVRGEKGIKEATLNINGKDIKIAVAHGLKNARTIMEEIKNGKSPYHFVEIMACPGGCVMGGGQPIHSSKERELIDIRSLRANALYTIDERSVLRKSHENPILQKIYKEYLGEPGGHKAHELLHTSYVANMKEK